VETAVTLECPHEQVRQMSVRALAVVAAPGQDRQVRLAGELMAQLWTNLPAGRVVRLVGASPEAIALSVEPLIETAPAILTYFADTAPSQAQVAAAILAQLETAALDLFPAWLPGAAGIASPGGAGIAAVRALALRTASATPHFGPFLAELAERALHRAGPGPDPRRFPAEVRAAGLARVVAASFDRPYAALLVRVPDGMPPMAEHALVAACEWLAHCGDLGVWLTGAPLLAVDRVEVRTVDLPAQVADLAGRETPELVAVPALPSISYPALTGRPHPGSSAEQALEAALAPRLWATGRAWNQHYQSHPLANPIRLDLLWAEERCVVEVDGPEHCGALRFAADRRRDVQLQLDGYAVLRFTNAQIQYDIEAVVSQIEQFIMGRRVGPWKGQ
jgi:very-short-patch-repair endonuclease